MIEVTLLGTGSPIPDARRAGPSTLVRAGGQTFLIDCGRGVQQRLTAAGAGANGLTALLLTHLHSDHIADLGDVIITRWVTTFDPNPAPLQVIGPPGTAEVVDATLKAFGFDIGYRIAHHADITGRRGSRFTSTPRALSGIATVCRSGWRRPITVPSLRPSDSGSSTGRVGRAGRRHGAVREPRRAGRGRGGVGAHRDSQGPRSKRCPYNGSGTSATTTHRSRKRRLLPTRAGVGILILTHYVPGIEPGQEDDWRALAASVFGRQIELGDDLHRVEVHPGVCARQASRVISTTTSRSVEPSPE